MVTKRNFLILTLFCVSFFAHSKDFYGSRQLLYADDWVLEAVEQISSETRTSLLLSSAPVSAAEVLGRLEKIDAENLSERNRKLYEKVLSRLSPARPFFSLGAFRFAFNVDVSPEILYKSNPEIDWSFATDYTGGRGYGAASNFSGNVDVKRLLSVPLYMDFGDIFFIETEPFFAKNFWGFSKDSNFLNIPLSPSELEFLFPSNAYISAGKDFGPWGFNFFLAKEGLSMGRTQTGSVIYNSTFQTDFVFQMNLYSQNVKYNLDVAEVSSSRFLYLHRLDIAPFRFLRIGIVEGTLLNAPFSLKYLNPLMIMHSFGSWNEYCSAEEKARYNEANACAYLGLDFDVNPSKHLRIYGAFAQNELQSFLELNADESNVGNYYPDSLAFQLGAEVNVPDAKDGNWTGSVEAVWTTPFCYVKQGAEWTLYRGRTDMNSGIADEISTWIGSPFGPDAMAVHGKLQYSSGTKWNCGLEWLSVAHGENSFGMFSEKGSDGWYTYYPSAAYLQGKMTADEARAVARNLLPSGTVSYTNRLTCRGHYGFDGHFSVDLKAAYSFIFNNKNVPGAFAHGVELVTSLNWKLF